MFDIFHNPKERLSIVVEKTREPRVKVFCTNPNNSKPLISSIEDIKHNINRKIALKT